MTLAAVAVGCSADPPEPDSAAVRVRDSAGVRIVENPAALPVRQHVWIVAPAPRMETGVTYGAWPYEFTNVGHVTRLEDGQLAAVNGNPLELRFFYEDGRHAVSRGRRGDGPGEIRSPGQLSWVGGDTVRSFDQSQFRVNWFSGKLGFIRSARVDRRRLVDLLGPRVRWERLAMLDDRSVIVATAPSLAFYPSEPGTLRPRYAVHHVDPTFTWVRDLGIRYGAPEQYVVELRRRMTAIDPPAAYRSHSAVGGRPSRVCFGDDAATIVDCFDLQRGRVSIRWEQPAIPLTEADVESWRRRQLGDTARRRDLGPDMERRLAMIELKATKSTMHSILIDTEGHVLVETADQAADQPSSRRFRVFGPAGRLIGFVDLPDIRVTEIGPDYVLGVGRLRYDVEQVVIYDLRRETSGDPPL